MKYYLLPVSFFILLSLTACMSLSEQSNAAKLNIHTSIYPIEYAVEQIGGKHIATETVYPPGVDAHTYEPAAKDMTAIAKSDAFFFLGAGMESFADNAASALASSDVELFEIGKHKELFVDPHQDNHAHDDNNTDHNHDHGDLDPHIWIDPIRMIDMSNIIKNALISIDPNNAEDYEANFTVLKKNLSKLNDMYHDILDRNPRNEIIVSHAAYYYWHLRYGLEQIPISGVSSSDEPSQKQLISIIKGAQERALKYVIFEQNTSDKVSEIVQEHINADLLTIHNLSVLTEADINNDRDYMSIMKDNLQVLDKATSN